MLQGIDGVALESGLRLSISAGVELGPTDSPDAQLGEGEVRIIRRDCPPELDDVMTADAGTIQCFLDGALEVVVTGPTQSPRQDLQVVAAPGAPSFPADLLAAHSWGNSGDGDAPPTPGTVVPVRSDSELAELWDEWRLDGPAPTIDPGSVVFGLVAQGSSCTHHLPGFVIVDAAVIQPDWGQEGGQGETACLDYLAPAYYVVAIDGDDLPADEVTIELTDPSGGGEDGRQLLGTGTIER
jgi:hypothetical protein